MTTLQVEKVIHINQVLGPFAAANRFYADVFGAVEYMNSYDPGEDRDASLFVIGDTCIELFSPRGDQSLLGRNLARFGDSFHSFELKVDDLEAAKAAFDERGVRVTTYRPGSFFMTHPKDGHGLLFELCPFDMANDPRVEPGWSAAPWRDDHPLGIDRLNAMSAAVVDVDAASTFVADLLGTDVLYREGRPGVGEVAGFWLGDTVLELVQPSDDDSPVAGYIERYGPRVRSLHFRVRDVDAVADHLAACGLHTPGDVDGWIALDPNDNYDVLYQFTEDALPNDPRR